MPQVRQVDVRVLQGRVVAGVRLSAVADGAAQESKGSAAIRGRRGSAAGPTERGEGAKSGDHREGEGEQEAAKGRERLELELELELVLFEFVLEFFELFERIGFLVVFELVVFV